MTVPRTTPGPTGPHFCYQACWEQHATDRDRLEARMEQAETGEEYAALLEEWHRLVDEDDPELNRAHATTD